MKPFLAELALDVGSIGVQGSFARALRFPSWRLRAEDLLLFDIVCSSEVETIRNYGSIAVVIKSKDGAFVSYWFNIQIGFDGRWEYFSLGKIIIYFPKAQRKIEFFQTPLDFDEGNFLQWVRNLYDLF